MQLKCFRRESGTCLLTASSLVASVFHWTRRLSSAPISTSQRGRQITHTAKLTMSVLMKTRNKLEKISFRLHVILKRDGPISGLITLSSSSLRHHVNGKSSFVQTKEEKEIFAGTVAWTAPKPNWKDSAQTREAWENHLLPWPNYWKILSQG